MVFLVESVQTEDSTELVLFSRDQNGNKKVEYEKDFRPYFYVLESEPIPVDHRITGVQKTYTSIDNRKLKKVFVKKSVDVSQIRAMFSTTYESDVPFNHRYIIDVLGEVETHKLKTLYFDIELNTEHDFPDMEVPDQEIISIAITDDFSNKSKLLLYQPKNAENRLKTTEQVKVYSSEKELLDMFVYYINDIDPDVISGWNIKGFDLPYLIKRMKQLEVEYQKISPLNSVNINDTYQDVYIKGRIILDMMEAYKHYRRISNQPKAESYSLEFTAQEELGAGKIKHKETFRDMWLNKPELLVEYNIRDNELVKQINDKFKIIEFFDNIRAKACCMMESIFHSSVLVDGFIMRYLRGKLILPNRNKGATEKYTGAVVLEPKPGLYENVLALDIKSMYPNIIITFNMGYDTLSDDGDITITDDIKFKSEGGFIPNVLKVLSEERSKYKKLMKEAKTEDEQKFYNYRQYAIKVIANSIYGYLGFGKSRLYKRDVAFAVTHMGQNLIKDTKSFLERLGYTVVYGDTDSCVYDTPIHVINNDKVLDIHIGDFFEYNLSDSKIETRGENNYIITPNKKYYTPSVNINTGKIELKPIKYIMGHKVKKKLYKIKTKDKEVTITEDHSIMVKRGKDMIEVKPKDIKPSDKLIKNDYISNKKEIIDEVVTYVRRKLPTN